jgi:hypothetical protein
MGLRQRLPLGLRHNPAPRQPPMTTALLIALVGSLALMAVIVRRLEQNS